MNRSALLVSLLVLVSTPLFGEPILLLGDFEEGWDKHWMERKFTGKRTEYRVVKEDQNPVLSGYSHRSASGLWRMLEIHPGASGTISWRWKVEKPLSENKLEREKQGDDYAARLFVVFEPHFFSWKTRAICYVWASHETSGSVFPSPYAESVGMKVLQSNDAPLGTWIAEIRDYVADYKSYFGEAPEMVTAVAIMIDTDDTQSQAAASFDHIRIE